MDSLCSDTLLLISQYLGEYSFFLKITCWRFHGIVQASCTSKQLLLWCTRGELALLQWLRKEVLLPTIDSCFSTAVKYGRLPVARYLATIHENVWTGFMQAEVLFGPSTDREAILMLFFLSTLGCRLTQVTCNYAREAKRKQVLCWLHAIGVYELVYKFPNERNYW